MHDYAAVTARPPPWSDVVVVALDRTQAVIAAYESGLLQRNT